MSLCAKSTLVSRTSLHYLAATIKNPAGTKWIIPCEDHATPRPWSDLGLNATHPHAAQIAPTLLNATVCRAKILTCWRRVTTFHPRLNGEERRATIDSSQSNPPFRACDLDKCRATGENFPDASRKNMFCVAVHKRARRAQRRPSFPTTNTRPNGFRHHESEKTILLNTVKICSSVNIWHFHFPVFSNYMVSENILHILYSDKI